MTKRLWTAFASAAALVVCAPCAAGKDELSGRATRGTLGERAHGRSARIAAPFGPSDGMRVGDPASGVSVAVTLMGATSGAHSTVGGLTMRRGGGPHTSDVFTLRTPQAVEDFVAFDRRPPLEALRYSVDVSRVAGLRLVDSVLEFLDPGGAPRIRMETPEFIDGRGKTEDARVVLEDCAADRNPSGPWGRAVTPPGRSFCIVRVEWAQEPGNAARTYPLLVDPAWSATTNTMTAARAGHTATVLTGGKVLVVGGEQPGATPTYLKSTELYDPTTNTFAAGPALAGARAFHVAVRLSSGDVVVAGGANAAGALSTSELYETATGKFRAVSPLQAAREQAAAVLLSNGKVLVTSGAAAGAVLPTAEIFDPTVGSWTFTTGNLTYHRVGHYVTTVPTGQEMVIGGESLLSGTLVVASSEYYVSATDSFTPAPALATGRHHFGAAVLSDSRILVAGGLSGTGTDLASAEIFDPNSGSWSAAGPLAHARSHHGLVALSNGAAVAMGGVATQGTVKTYLRSAEIFDPTANKWAALGDLVTARSDHAAVVLSSGTVLVTGGFSSATAATATAELLAPDKNGAQCTTGLTCASKQCVDGVCCESACTSTCFACAKTATGVADGTCGPALVGKDPHGSCKDDGAPSCGQNGLCDGSGGCAKYPAAPCKPNPCASGADCTSGNCADGICCDKACSGTCEACTAAKKGSGTDGTCDSVAAGTDPDVECGSMGTGNCKGDATCDGSGACKVPNAGKSCTAAKCADTITLSEAATCGAAGDCTPATKTCSPYRCDATAAACKTSCAADTDCAPGGTCVSGACHLKDNGQACKGDGECTSNHCVDGYCCDTVCDAQCAACDVSGSEGTCSPVSGAPHGARAACTGSPPCGGACNGRLSDTCSYPLESTSCGSSHGCADGSVTSQKCNGFGDCVDLPGERCAPFACSGTACKTTCSTDADCASGYRCDSTDGCVLRNPASCADSGGKMCAPVASAPGDEGGCGCRISERTEGRGAYTALSVLLFGAGARFRKNRRGERRTSR